MDNNTEFIEIEKRIRTKIATLVKDNNLQSGLKIITDELNQFVKKKISNVYLFSLSLLNDDVFDIYFPATDEANSKGLYSFAYLDYGFIGYYCKKALKNKEKTYVFKNKTDLLQAHEMVQRIIFVSNERIQSFIISPIVFEDVILGAIQVSLNKSIISEEEEEKIKIFLSWLQDKICWMLFAEKNRINAILNIAESLINALESKNNYQASHSKNVTGLVLAFVRFIHHEPDYKEIIYGKNNNLSGLDIIKLKLASLLHDIGKFVMSDESFDKPQNKMSVNERLKKILHPFFTYKILSSNSLTKEIAQLASMHHERYSNDGHPWGLKSNELSVESQLISFADKIDSMARERPNNESRESLDYILDELKKDRAKKAFDNNLYNILTTILVEFRDNPGDRTLSYMPNIKELLGIDNKIARTIQLHSTSLNSYQVFENFIKLRKQINPEEWIVLFLVSFPEENIKIKSALEDSKLAADDILVYNIDNKSYTVWGLYYPSNKKEFAYDFCTKLDTQLIKICKMTAVFLDYKMIDDETIEFYESRLCQSIKTIQSGDRWKLLMN